MTKKEARPRIVAPLSAYSIRPLVLRTLRQSGLYAEADAFERRTAGVRDLVAIYEIAAGYVEFVERN